MFLILKNNCCWPLRSFSPPISRAAVTLFQKWLIFPNKTMSLQIRSVVPLPPEPPFPSLRGPIFDCFLKHFCPPPPLGTNFLLCFKAFLRLTPIFYSFLKHFFNLPPSRPILAPLCSISAQLVAIFASTCPPWPNIGCNSRQLGPTSRYLGSTFGLLGLTLPPMAASWLNFAILSDSSKPQENLCIFDCPCYLGSTWAHLGSTWNHFGPT
jgi:hypothetical protein